MVTDNILLKPFLCANTLAKKIKVLINIVQKVVSFRIWFSESGGIWSNVGLDNFGVPSQP